ncbi:hypothetical protein HY091_01235 [Candidatus Kaiserbacteria bacterium]|nr:hypothetical protein [Candidatus Kaiserbacteria bacterium]
MEVFDKEKIGKCIAWGGEHLVYDYGDTQVIKFSLFDLLIGLRLARIKTMHDLTICREFFSDYMLSTTLVSSSDGRRLAKLQPKITGRAIKKSDLQDKRIAQQFKEIIRAHQALVAQGYYGVDLIGGRGVLLARPTNIFLTVTGKLYLIDTLLLSVPELPWLQWLFNIFRDVAIWNQIRIIKSFLSACEEK